MNLTAPTTAPPEPRRLDDLEALIKEARRRQRRRWLAAVAVGIVVAVLAAGLYGGFGGSAAHRPTAESGGRGLAGRAGSASGDFSNAFVALGFSPIRGQELWAANGAAIDLSEDGGSHWTNITPANLVGDDPGPRIAGFASSGPGELWFAASEAGDSTAQGSRGFATEHSTNGGRTWHWTGLPACDGCSMSFSFLGPRRGWALGSNGNLYETTDAGIRWSLLAKAPTAVSALPDGVDFTSPNGGWLTASRSLYASKDGGRIWRKVTLPTVGPDRARPARLGSPRVFTSRVGLVPAYLSNGQAVVYRTSDAGAIWKAEPLPVSVTVNTPGWWTLPTLVTSSESVWSIRSGVDLFVSDDSGHVWSRVSSPPLYAESQPVWGFAMATATTGWIDASAAPCTTGPRKENCGVPILLRTTDGGRAWHTINNPAA